MRTDRDDWNRSCKTILLTVSCFMLAIPTPASSDGTKGTQEEPSASEEKGDSRNAPATTDDQKPAHTEARIKHGEPTIPSLEQMLATALDNHPDVRAAEARLRAAQADLDRTRLDVVQKTIEFRQKWQALKGEITHAELDFRVAPSKHERAMAVEKLDRLKTDLSGFEAQLRFLLGGKSPEPAATKTSTLDTRAQAEKMLAAAELTLNLTMQVYETGGASVHDVYQWSRRMTEAERLADPAQAKRIAAAEAHRSRMQSLLKPAEERYKAGEASHMEVLAVGFYVAEADIWLSEAKAK